MVSHDWSGVCNGRVCGWLGSVIVPMFMMYCTDGDVSMMR